jgi:formamidopyrimidine-DNA glycosylase
MKRPEVDGFPPADAADASPRETPTPMPELPDITVYIEALETRIVDEPLQQVRINSPFLVRTFEPPLEEVHGKTVRELRRFGKRIGIGLDDDYWLILHLMIAGRLHWKPPGTRLIGNSALAAFDFPLGTLTLTEAGAKRRASLHLVQGETALAAHRHGGLEVLSATLTEFQAVLQRRNHTLKRALTDPTLFSGIGNSYSDEILHRAKLSPFVLTKNLIADDAERLYAATQSVLREWIDRLRQQAGGKFPEHVTAFRPEMAVHGRFGLPCPVCDAKIQRIIYAENETNYCPVCQTEGRILADRELLSNLVF